MEEKNLENEELRKQIQFLTDVIENAKTRGHDRPQQPTSYNNFPANYIQDRRPTISYRPVFQKAASHPYFAERNTRLNTKAFSHEHSNLIGPASENARASQSKFQYDLKGANVQTDKEKNLTEMKCRSSSCQSTVLPKTLSSVVKTADNLDDVAKLKKSTVEMKHKSLTQSAHLSTNSIGLDKNKDTIMKSSSNSGNLNTSQMKSKSNHSSLLQIEIEKMHSKIANLKKALQEKQLCKSTTVTGKCKGELGKKCQRKPTVECSMANLTSSENNGSRSVESCVEYSHSSVIKQTVVKQQSILSAISKNPVTKSDSLVKKKEINFSPERSREEEKKTANFSVTHTQGLGIPNVRSSVKNICSSLEQPNSDLVSLSKYKLTRLGSSPTKNSPSKTIETAAIVSQRTASNFRGRFNLDQKPVQSLTENQTNFLRDTIPATKSCSSNTPAKFIKKSKYSITRVKSLGTKGSSRKKLARSQSNTPAKFVSFSKYAMKRVRRSLSDENKQMLKKNTDVLKPVNKFNKGSTYSYSLQPSFCVLRSKFKMEKVKSSSAVRSSSSVSSSSSESAPSYNFYRKVYQQRNYRPFTQRYQSRQYRRTNFGYSGYFKKGGYYSRFKGQGWPYQRHGMGRYGIGLPHHSYSRRQAVSERYLSRRLQRLRESVPFNPKHRLDRRSGIQDQKAPANFIMINGMLYRSNAKTLVKAVSQKTDLSKAPTGVQQSKIKRLDPTNMKTITVRGVKFKVDREGRSLKSMHQEGLLEGKPHVSSASKSSQISRVDIGGVTYVQTKPGTLERVGSMKSRMAATRVVNKTVQRAAAKYRKDNTKVLKKKKYCMFYNRFGKCNKKGSCTYIHDPEKVAVCTRFLRGTCKVEDCPFSHKVSKDKMPVCSYFLKGVCNRDKCPYLHVNVNRDAEICQDFVKGYCPQGEKCKKKHILKCPEFTQTGSCSKGEKCTLQHRRGTRKPQMLDQFTVEDSKKRKVLDQATSSKSTSIEQVEESMFTLETETNKQASDVDSEVDLPFKERKLPAYISLKTNTSKVKDDVVVILEDEHKQTGKASMKIRPQL